MLQEYQEEHNLEFDYIYDDITLTPEKKQKIDWAMDFYGTFLQHIEINFKGELVRVYFTLDPYTFHLSPNTVKILHQQEYMETPAEKLKVLFQLMPEIHNETIWIAWLNTQYLGFLCTYQRTFGKLSLWLCMLINFIIFSTQERKVKNYVSYEVWQPIWGVGNDNSTNWTLIVLGVIEIVIGCMLLVIWIVINGVLILKREWRQKAKVYN